MVIVPALILCALAITHPQGSAHAASALEGDVPPIYVAMAPITIPLVRSGYLEGSFHIRLDIAVSSTADEARVTQLIPRLEAAYLSALSDLTRFYISPGKQTDIDMIGRILQQATDHILGNDNARLLISDTAIHY